MRSDFSLKNGKHSPQENNADWKFMNLNGTGKPFFANILAKSFARNGVFPLIIFVKVVGSIIRLKMIVCRVLSLVPEIIVNGIMNNEYSNTVGSAAAAQFQHFPLGTRRAFNILYIIYRVLLYNNNILVRPERTDPGAFFLPLASELLLLILPSNFKIP